MGGHGLLLVPALARELAVMVLDIRIKLVETGLVVLSELGQVVLGSGIVKSSLDHVIVLQTPCVAGPVTGVMADIARLVAFRSRGELKRTGRSDIIGTGYEGLVPEQYFPGILREKSPADHSETQ